MRKVLLTITTFVLVFLYSNDVCSQAKLNVLIIGAHPDDCEIGAGGLAALYLKSGHRVKFVSMTDGEKGHHLLSKDELRLVRKKETEQVCKQFGIAYDVLDNLDGELQPTLENRLELIRQMREWDADVVITHRPNTYHPDHRYTSTLVLDASFLVRVPHVLPEVPVLKKTPVFLYMSDKFIKPNPFKADFAVDISAVVEDKVDMMHHHKSQFYEWLPWINGLEGDVPNGDLEKRAWLKQNRVPEFTKSSAEIDKAIFKVYDERKKSKQIKYIELYELCEYGRQIKDEEVKMFFPFNN